MRRPRPATLARTWATRGCSHTHPTALRSHVLSLSLTATVTPPPPTLRYYGLSLPFGDASYAPENLGLLSIEQCLADYSSVVASLLANLSATGTAPVIGFGGSYGGMLALWGRMRYPHVYAGVIASSAPILQVPGLMDPKAYNGIITTDYRDANPTAPAVVANAFTGLLAAPAAYYPALQRAMRMCNAWESIDDVYSAVVSAARAARPLDPRARVRVLNAPPARPVPRPPSSPALR